MEKKVNVEKSLTKFANLVSQPKVKYSIMIIFLLVFSFIVQYFVNRPNFGAFLSSDMDPSSNVYILGVDENKDLYKLMIKAHMFTATLKLTQKATSISSSRKRI